jgi:hypothetical protein
MWGTEMAWRIVDDTMQIRGGRGYETADSLKARGERPVPVERFMRDCRINTIFEGSSEIMRLFIAREALDPHLKVSGAALNSRLSIGERVKAAIKAGVHYAQWYPKQWLPFGDSIPAGLHPRLATPMRYVRRTTRQLARRLFHTMVFYGPKLEKQQVLLSRFVEIGTELFAVAASCMRAQHLIGTMSTEEKLTLLSLVEYFSNETKHRIREKFRGISFNNDAQGYRLAQDILRCDLSFLNNDFMKSKDG